jgi:hypothetical protein
MKVDPKLQQQAIDELQHALRYGNIKEKILASKTILDLAGFKAPVSSMGCSDCVLDTYSGKVIRVSRAGLCMTCGTKVAEIQE